MVWTWSVGKSLVKECGLGRVFGGQASGRGWMWQGRGFLLRVPTVPRHHMGKILPAFPPTSLPGCALASSPRYQSW